MTERIYISNTKITTFVCPKCHKSKTVNVSKYVDLDKKVKVMSDARAATPLAPFWKNESDIAERRTFPDPIFAC